MISNELFQDLKIGQMVYVISRPGDFADDEMATMQGPIVEKSETKWGYDITIEVEQCAIDPKAVGTRQNCSNVYRVGERLGIGAYVK